MAENNKNKICFEPYEGEEPFLFISYSHENTDIVYPILNRLDEEKFRIWFDDTMEVGEDFRDELRENIEACTAFVLFVSKASMASKYCGMEIITAYKNNKKIYPIYVEDDVEIPPAFTMMLEHLQHVKGVSENLDSKYVAKMISGLPVEAMRTLVISDGVLKNCKDGSRIIHIPENVKTVGKAAFKNCEKLEEVYFSDGIETIRDEGFRGCKSIKELCFPESVRHIEESAFRDCISLKGITVTNEQIEIGERAFENCQELRAISLPDGLTEIYGGVFNSCKSLEEIKLPEDLTILGESAFASCISLKSIHIPERVTKIDDMAFSGCSSMKELILSHGLNKIGKNAFKDCITIKDVFIPATVHTMGTSPFRGCESLESITVDPKNKHFKSVDDVLFNKNKSVLICHPAEKDQYEYEIPDSVTVVSDWAFCGCSRLSKITIPDSVNEIGEGAFYRCTGLKSIEIPDSVEKIDDTAFRGCESLEYVILPSSIKEFGWGLFNGCDKVRVCCTAGSEAEEYCRVKHIAYELMEEA